MTAHRVSLAIVSIGLMLLLVWIVTIVTRPANRFDDWLRAAAGGEEDRGWQYLGVDTHDTSYHGDRHAYLEEARAADWSQFEWDEPEVRWTDDGFAHVEAGLLSTGSSVPRFVIDRQLIHGICDHSRPVGIGVFEDRRLFHAGGLGGGGVTGSGAECNALFTGEVLPEDRYPEVLPGRESHTTTEAFGFTWGVRYVRDRPRGAFAFTSGVNSDASEALDRAHWSHGVHSDGSLVSTRQSCCHRSDAPGSAAAG
ncbi:MAG: hypothetical protein ABIP01_04325 [Candidatus Limnocylindria bacterium]